MRLCRELEGLSLLVGTASKDLQSAVLLVIACVLTGAFLAITLVLIVGKEHRVDAIRATADLIWALMPWRTHRRKK